MTRVYVTGLGVISPLARGADATMDRIVRGDRAFGPLELFSVEGSRVTIAAQIPDLTVEEVAPKGEEEGWSRTDAMAILAAREALAQAGVAPGTDVIDLLLGGTTAGMFETEDLLAWLSRDPDAITPLGRMLSHPLSSTADHVRAAVGPFRHVRSICSACSSGANAILLGAAWIQSGRSDLVIAGGADGLCRLTYTGFGALGALDPNACRPFDKRRAGLNLGEAAAFLVLESEERAIARGKKPIAELVGWAIGAEAHHITNPQGDGATASRVMRQALARAQLATTDIDYVNAHGTATPLNDAMETKALHDCFGAAIDRVAVSSTKGQIGHTLAAAGAIEAAITAMAVARGVIPPTAGLEEVDPECQLAHVREARHADVRAAMTNSFGFGGTDTVLVIAKPGFAPEKRGAKRRPVVVTGAATLGPLGIGASTSATAYLEAGPPPAAGPIAFQASEHLDVGRARRLDRAGRLTTVAVQTALREAKLTLDGDAGLDVGAIMGTAFGSVDASTAYMRRIYDKGAKYASPADFPNLVPSSPVGHSSIYLGLRGPVVATADLGVTAESAIVSAAELIEAGEGSAMFAGSVEEASPMIERCLGPICSRIFDRGVRGEGASTVLLEAREHAEARGAAILARLAWWSSWRGSEASWDELPSPPARALVLSGRDDLEISHALDASSWSTVERRSLASRAGDHEGAGGFAAVAAVAEVARGEREAVLVVGAAPDRGYALLFLAP